MCKTHLWAGIRMLGSFDGIQGAHLIRLRALMSVPIDSWVHADSLGLLCETYLRAAVGKQGSADSI